MTLKHLAGVTAIAALFAALPAHATLVTTSADFVSPTIDTFSAYGFCATFAQAGCTPPQTLIGTAIQYEGTAGARGSSLTNGVFALAANGEWTSGRDGYVGNDDRSVFSRFTFSTALSAIGGLFNYAPGIGGPFTITAYDAIGNVLESYNIDLLAPISTPAATNAGAFRGISRTQGDIFAFQFENEFSVVDDLTFSAAPAQVPEPPLLALLSLGLIGHAMSRRSRQR